VTEKLGYRKLCPRWVPKILTDDRKTKRMGSALKFLTRYAQEGDEFLDSIVTGDEKWVFHHTPESKQQSLQWRHTHSPRTKKKIKTSFSIKKIMASVFWNRKGIPLAQQFMPLHTVTPWQGFDKPFKTRCHVRVPAPPQRADPFRAHHHCSSVKIQVGYTGPTAVESGLCAQRFPIVSSPKETSRWEKVRRRRRRRGSRRSHEVVQTAGFFYDSGYRSLFQDLINVWTMPATCWKVKLCTDNSFTVSLL